MSEAVERYEQALQFQPGFAAAHYNAGVCLAKIGRRTEAIEHFQRALLLAEADGREPIVQAARTRLRQRLDREEQHDPRHGLHFRILRAAPASAAVSGKAFRAAGIRLADHCRQRGFHQS